MPSTNAQSVINKFPKLQAVVCDHAQQIIGLAEFWCSSSIDDAEMVTSFFNRPSEIGSGVLQYFTYIFHCQLSHVRGPINNTHKSNLSGRKLDQKPQGIFKPYIR